MKEQTVDLQQRITDLF